MTSIERRMEKRQKERIKWFTALLLLVFLVQSCVSLNTLYGWIDTYIKWEVDSFFDVTAEQEAFMDRQLKALIDSHKTDEMPKYISFLQEIKSRLQRKVEFADIDWFRDSLRQYNANIAHILADDVAEFLSGISENQVVYLREQLVEDNESWLEEHNSKGNRFEKTHERVENWIGDLTDEQKERIAEIYKSNIRQHELRYRRRLTSQKRFMEALEGRSNKRELKANLLAWYLKPEQYYSQEYQQTNKISMARTTEMVLMLDQTATPEQREHINRKLDDYIAQLQAILAD